MKNRYQVIVGQHHEGKVVYKAGQIVESESDLCKRFAGKFTDLGPVHEEQVAKRPSKSKPVVDVDEDEEDIEEVESKPKAKAKATSKKSKSKKDAGPPTEDDDDWK